MFFFAVSDFYFSFIRRKFIVMNKIFLLKELKFDEKLFSEWTDLTE